jgi:hypothetical protein
MLSLVYLHVCFTAVLLIKVEDGRKTSESNESPIFKQNRESHMAPIERKLYLGLELNGQVLNNYQ